MSRGKGRGGAGDARGPDALRDAMRGVNPLSDRNVLRAPTPPPAGAPRSADTGSVRFEIERAGERVAGIAPGIDRRELRRLRRGEVDVDIRVDLHGRNVPRARRALSAAFEEALAAGDRCVLVVHGRGLHSEGGPVLKDAFLTWLAEPPVGPRVMAFASAVAANGGPGATYVLLRRPR